MIRGAINARSQYLDLLVRILTNSIYEDGQIHPHLPDTYNRNQRENGADWPRLAHTMVGAKRLRNLAELTCRVIDNGVPGDFIETGVWRGGCCILMRALLAYHGDTARRVFAADSFEGLPKPKSDIYVADTGDMHHTFAQLAVSLEQVQENFARYGLLDARTVFVKGYFDQTLPTLKDNRFALLRLDGDMYESTICALENLYPLLSNGGYVIIDDFGAIPACAKAVNDYRAANNITAPMQKADWTGIWWRKE